MKMIDFNNDLNQVESAVLTLSRGLSHKNAPRTHSKWRNNVGGHHLFSYDQLFISFRGVNKDNSTVKDKVKVKFKILLSIVIPATVIVI